MLSNRTASTFSVERLRQLIQRIHLQLNLHQSARPRPWRAPPPRRTPPAMATWLSLISTASSSPNRWFDPPPTRTAYFCANRSPGIVLRVQQTRARGSHRSHPRSRASRTPRHSDDRGNSAPSVPPSAPPAPDRSPSRSVSPWPQTAAVGQRHLASLIAGSISRNAAVAKSSPATTPGWRATRVVNGFGHRLGTMASVVRSPARPRSSSKRRSDRRLHHDQRQRVHQRTASMRSTERRARTARAGSMVTALLHCFQRTPNVQADVMRFICGHRLHGTDEGNIRMIALRYVVGHRAFRQQHDTRWLFPAYDSWTCRRWNRCNPPRLPPAGGHSGCARMVIAGVVGTQGALTSAAVNRSCTSQCPAQAMIFTCGLGGDVAAPGTRPAA